MYRNALQIHVPRTGTDVDVILAAVEEYLMMLAKKRINTKCFKTKKNSQPMEQRILSTKVPTPIREPSFILRRLTIFNITYSSPKCNELQMFLDGS